MGPDPRKAALEGIAQHSNIAKKKPAEAGFVF
jgi:hypothetical protein